MNMKSRVIFRTLDRRCNDGIRISGITTDNIENTLEIIRKRKNLYSNWVTVIYNNEVRRVRL